MTARAKSPFRSLSILAVCMLVGVAAAATAPATARGPAAAVDPQAIAALERMGAFLRGQRDIHVRAESTTDDALGSGQKVQYGGVADLYVRRPNRLRANIASDRKNEQLYYDGTTFTVSQPGLGYYAQFPAPPTLVALADVAEHRYGLDLPLADLFYWGTPRAQKNDIRAATHVGSSTVKGTPTDHYAFRQPDVDWEIWIEKGPLPLPRRLVITTTSEPSQPQHTATLTWNLSPSLDDGMFAFVPPPGSHRIAIEPADGLPPAMQASPGSNTMKKGISP